VFALASASAAAGGGEIKNNTCPNGEVILKDILAFDHCGDCSQFKKGIQAKHYTILDVLDTGVYKADVLKTDGTVESTSGFKNTVDQTKCEDNDELWKGTRKDGVTTVKTSKGNNINDMVAGSCDTGDVTTGKCGPVHVVSFAKGNMILEYDHALDAEKLCEGGMFLPFIPGEMMWGKTFHIIIYFFLMVFSFLGIAIIADVFMAAIEVITSKEKTLTIMENGKEKKVTYLVWNATIANLTLMALGSSAPEILLSVIETLGTLNKTANPGGLGPGTIVGSAAFNLLVIVAICVMAIDGKKEDGSPDFRKIDELGVFTVTAIYSVLAYVWLFLCVMDNSVTLVEAIITFLLFPVLVTHCYLADKKMIPAFLGGGTKKASEHLTGSTGMGAGGYGQNGDLEKQIAKLDAVKLASSLAQADSEALAGFSSNGRRGSASGLSGNDAALEAAKEEIARLAVQEHLAGKKQSIMQSKINARRQLAGKQRTTVKKKDTSSALQAIKDDVDQKAAAPSDGSGEDKTFVTFASSGYSVLESAGKVNISVQCHRGTKDSAANVHVVCITRDGTALSGEDYVHVRHEVHFAPGESEKVISVELIDDTEYEPDENFLVVLQPSNAGRKGKQSDCEVEFFPQKITNVVIENDDLPGTFGFATEAYQVGEKGENGQGYAEVKVERTKGSDGEVTVKYKTVDGSAIAGDDYEPAVGELVFKHQETSKTIKVNLIDDDAYEKSETFTIELVVDGTPANGALTGIPRTIVTILGDEDSAKVVNEVALLMKLQLDKLSLNTTSWGQQFDEAMNIQGEEGEDPAVMDYVMHCMTFGWKVVFAIVPPTCYKDGWVTFFVALGFIGILTAFVADIAGIFGCLLGLKDAITAITFVALGTSLPDTFASKSAAVNDESADASVGNVTGSNSVNVFLGLGLPWLMATIVHTLSDFQSDPVLSKGEVVEFLPKSYPMIAGSLGFSVVLFCICAIVCIVSLYIRRFLFGYELGGDAFPRKVTGAFFIGLWMLYVVMSSLEVEGHIKSFI